MKRSLVLSVVLALSVACALHTAKATIQLGALSIGESVLAVDQAERQVRAANLPDYTVAEQNTVGAGILKALYAARGFERAAVAVPASGSSADLTTARAGLASALADLGTALPATQRVRTPILAAISAAQAALAAWKAE